MCGRLGKCCSCVVRAVINWSVRVVWRCGRLWRAKNRTQAWTRRKPRRKWCLRTCDCSRATTGTASFVVACVTLLLIVLCVCVCTGRLLLYSWCRRVSTSIRSNARSWPTSPLNSNSSCRANLNPINNNPATVAAVVIRNQTTNDFIKNVFFCAFLRFEINIYLLSQQPRTRQTMQPKNKRHAC